MKKTESLINKRFNRLIVLTEYQIKGKPGYYCNCLCDCGNYKIVSSGNLKSENVQSCGCLHKEKQGNRLIILTGQKFGKLTVIGRCNKDKNNHAMWLCQCDCGKNKCIAGSSLVRGMSTSCGCNKKYRKKSTPQDIYQYLLYTFNSYKSKSKRMKLEFELSFSEFCKIICEDCFYCNYESINTIDRIDSDKGYIKNNIVPCCLKCNLAKSNFSIKEFLDYLNIFYEMKESPLKLLDKINQLNPKK